MEVTVVIPTHNPDPARFRETLAGLRDQTLSARHWSLLVVDNASRDFPAASVWSDVWPRDLPVIREPALGLTAARMRGIREATTPFIVFVDDDNVLAPDYLACVLEIFSAHPRLAAAGGRSEPRFETPPPAWIREFDGLLACRDLGPAPLVATALWNEQAKRNEYPAFAPIGAGMALRRAAALQWADSAASAQITDRRGGELTSGGDNDIVLTLLGRGWHVGYFPTLTLTHLIPSSRTEPAYLARLNRGIARSWVCVLAKHHASPWAAIPSWTVPLRRAKAWFAHRAWSGPAARIRWQGVCGHFEGLAAGHANSGNHSFR